MNLKNIEYVIRSNVKEECTQNPLGSLKKKGILQATRDISRKNNPPPKAAVVTNVSL